MDRGAATLTTRGWAVVVVAGVAVAAAALFGIEELYPIGAAALVLVVATRLWASGRAWDVRVARRLRPARVPAGAEARVDLTARNHGPARSPLLAVSDPFDEGRRRARFLLAPLEPGETVSATYRLPTSQRGVFPLGPLALELLDPFGLARVRRRVEGSSARLTVHPRVDAVTSRSLPADVRHEVRVPLPVLGEGGDEFYGLREYRVGDDLRRIHWWSTARVDELMIRQPENLWKGRVTIAVDLRADVHDSVSLEETLSAVASIAVAALRSDVHVRLLTSGGADTGFGVTLAHRATILDLLASAQVHPGPVPAELFRARSMAGPVTVVTTDTATDPDIATLVGPGRRERATIVIFERGPRRAAPAAARGHGLRAAGFTTGRPGQGTVVRVPRGGSFPACWEGARC